MPNKNIIGIHEGDRAGDIVLEQVLRGRGGILTLHEIGADPEDRTGFDHGPWVRRGYWTIGRLQYSFGGGGTVPGPAARGRFVERVRNFVMASPACHVWVLGNELNHEQEKGPDGPVDLAYYGRLYADCRAAGRGLPGHENDRWLPAPVAPWNASRGDWLQFFELEIAECAVAAGKVDGIALHAYTHGSDPDLITSMEKMAAPGYTDRLFHFRHVWQFVERIPVDVRGLPLYILETDQGDVGGIPVPWDNSPGRTWAQEAAREVGRWNAGGGPQVRALIFYRYPRHDAWYLEGKPQALADISAAVDLGIEWKGDQDMGSFETVWHDGFERGGYDQDGIPEVTIPLDHKVIWDPARVRPEMDMKDGQAGGAPVHSGRYSAVGFHRFNMFRWVCYTTKPIAVAAGKRTRARASFNVISHGKDGDPSVLGHCGMRCGLAPFSVSDPESGSVVWSDWATVTANQNADPIPERTWVERITAEMIPDVGQVRLFVQCNADIPVEISAGHWDDETVEQWSDSDVPPPVDPPPSDGTIPAQLRGIAEILISCSDALVSIAGSLEGAGVCDPAIVDLIRSAHGDLTVALASVGGG